MTQNNDEFDEYGKHLLARLRDAPTLDPRVFAEERAKFLAQGEIFRAAVSQPKNHRHIVWINTFVLAFHRKERIPMLNTLMALIITIIVLFGGAGVSVYAAQDSLPDETLFPVKTWSENVRMSLASSVQERLNLVLDFTDRRVAEISNMHVNAQPIAEVVAIRLQEELEEALQIAAGMEDPQMTQALEQIRQKAEIQSQTMTTMQEGGLRQSDPALRRLQERLQEQVRLATAGESDPYGFRLLVRERERQNRLSQTPNPNQPGTILRTPGATSVPTGNNYGPGSGKDQATGTPGHISPGEPNPSQTPMPIGGDYGPGPGAGQRTSSPGGYGPGPQAGTSTCTPVQNAGELGNGLHPPSTTQKSVDPGPRTGQATATPQQGGNPGGGQSTTSPDQSGQP
jgi:Domain of unknown function (DUF5667)